MLRYQQDCSQSLIFQNSFKTNIMKRLLIVLNLLFILVSCFSQSDNIIYLWPGDIPNDTNEKQDAVEKIDTVNNIIDVRLTEVTNPLLEVFEPKRSEKNGAGIIVCPGGGYNRLAITKEGYEIAAWLNNLGYTAFVLQYRVPDKYEVAINDIQRAIRVVRNRAKEWNLNPEKIGAIGFSAGASLSARASTQFKTETYAKIDDADNNSSKPDFALLIYPGGLDQGENRTLTPELTVQPETPPMFIFATADDKHGNSALVMAGAMRDAGIPAELHLLPFGGHGYGLRKGNVAAETWPVLAEGWLQKTVLQEDVVYDVKEVIPTDAPEKLVKLMNNLAAKETNPLLKRHFESMALFATDTTHGFQVTEENMKDASQVLRFFENEGSKWETYVNEPRPLIMSFKSPTDGKYSFYKLFLPKDFRTNKADYPFYIELHGYSGGRNDNPRRQVFMSLKPEILGVTSQGYRKEGLFVQPWGRGDKWYRGIAETDIYEVLDNFDKTFKTDPTRQYLYGFSMGGGGSFKIAQKTMNRWAAVGLYSGAIFNYNAEEAAKFKDTPVWMVWGEEEERIKTANVELKNLFLDAGVELKWKEIPQVGHKYLGEYQDDLMDWFRTKTKED